MDVRQPPLYRDAFADRNASQALKDRYYSVCRILAANRPGPEPADQGEKERLEKARQEAVASFSFDLSALPIGSCASDADHFFPGRPRT